jgi:hypothetical protein
MVVVVVVVVVVATVVKPRERGKLIKYPWKV